eukprot:360973-Chlamydomonas_euryale.AAC.11
MATTVSLVVVAVWQRATLADSCFSTCAWSCMDAVAVVHRAAVTAATTGLQGLNWVGSLPATSIRLLSPGGLADVLRYRSASLLADGNRLPRLFIRHRLAWHRVKRRSDHRKRELRACSAARSASPLPRGSRGRIALWLTRLPRRAEAVACQGGASSCADPPLGRARSRSGLRGHARPRGHASVFRHSESGCGVAARRMRSTGARRAAAAAGLTRRAA